MGEPVSQKDFDAFIQNDFKHLSVSVRELEGSVQKLERSVSFIKGEVAVFGPLILSLLGNVLAVILKR